MSIPPLIPKLVKTHGYKLVLLSILIASFAIRVINLNYNSPFSDEAIYVVVGKFGLFQGDWVTYGSANWVAGLPMLYPSLTAIVYSFGGIVTSRLINVIFGVLLIETIFILTTQLTPPTKLPRLPGLIAAAILGAAGTGLYVSRLATYDMPSFYLLILSLVILHRAFVPNSNFGRWYFLAAITLIFSFFTKIITGIYIPLIIVYSFLVVKNLGAEQLFYWKRYFFGCLVIGLGIYTLFNIQALSVYGNSEVTREWADWPSILSLYWDSSRLIWPFFMVGSLGLFLKRQFALWAYLTIAALWILLFHLAGHRLSTLDKHTFLTVIFLSPIIGIGLTNLIQMPAWKSARIILSTITLASLILFWQLSYTDLDHYNNFWTNTASIDNYLASSTHQGDKVLTETGPSIILATYNQNYPINITTFDWFEYQKLIGDKAYNQALQDGYFDFIELESTDLSKKSDRSDLHDLVASQLDPNYKLQYSLDGYEIYKRIY